MARLFARTVRRMVPAIAAILCMLALGFVTKYSGMDAVLGLAFTRTGPLLYPIFGTLLGWLGVALTGSDTSSNVLFGNLQKITAQKLGLNPILMASANSTGGVMGKMIDAQSIVVAAAATGEGGSEGELLRAVFWHSILLALLVGAIVWVYAHVIARSRGLRGDLGLSTPIHPTPKTTKVDRSRRSSPPVTPPVLLNHQWTIPRRRGNHEKHEIPREGEANWEPVTAPLRVFFPSCLIDLMFSFDPIFCPDGRIAASICGSS